ncbi:MAG: D-alanyl-D-alanine carboxypeptidase [Clostridia bacterium]|nr:D-alanyl-D-alanine carboxypeptidase [Clostridia bacterium]
MYEPLPVSSAAATPVGQVLEIKAQSAVLLEPRTMQLLYESNADERLSPASITKIMSLLLVVEAIDAGHLQLTDTITASEYACSMGGSQIWLEPGETMTVDELLKACFIASANDATVALAEAVAGSEEAFVAEMNARAAELGMINTVFKNTTGLDAEGHYTTAYDVALMSAELMKHEIVKSYSTVWMDSLRGGKSELVNTNKLVRFYEGCTGLKTGTTSAAGHCLAATAERNGLSLVAVVLKAPSSNDRFESARKLLNYGFANYNFSYIEYDNSLPLEAHITGGVENTVTLCPEGGLNVLLKKSDKGSITQSVRLNGEICAPIKKGDVIGTVTVYNGDTPLGEIELLAEKDVEKLSFFYLLKKLLYELFIM